MESKRFALFLRQLAESLREDLHARKARTGDVLEAYADELDPRVVAAPDPEAASLESPPIVEPPTEEAPLVTHLREKHAEKEHRGAHHKR